MRKFEGEVLSNAVFDVVLGQAMAFRAETDKHEEGWRILSVEIRTSRGPRFDARRTVERFWTGSKKVGKG